MKGKAVMFGAGNIGRGFIGQLFSESGYEVVFVDVVQELLDLFNRDHHYRLQTVSNEGSKDYSIGPVSGVDSRNQAAVAEAVAEASICATAVGANVLKFVAPNLAAGLALRAKRNLPPINVIVCENLHGAPEYLRGLLEQSIPAEAKAYLAEKTGLVETVIGRMVPAPTPEMRAQDIGWIKVEPYKELPVKRSGFVGPIPDIVAMMPYDDFDVFGARKLYVHNCGHALMSYVAYQRGYEYAYEALEDKEIRSFMLAGLRESVDGICAKFKADRDWLYAHVDDLLKRFANRSLGDTVYRLGRDPIRKLAAEDRLVGAANLAVEGGSKPAHLAWGIAAALLFNPADDPSAPILQAKIKENGVEAALAEVSGIQKDSVLGKLVLDAYEKLLVNPKAIPAQ
ncbi:MAG: mannitol dehydrogenase [Lentisphaeria bacterium]|nr:mannitol dehydrogenase [Lentisphaeria bacterium]